MVELKWNGFRSTMRKRNVFRSAKSPGKRYFLTAMPQYILALDQGTTSSRAIVFDHAGQIVASAQQEFPQILPAPGIVEHDPEAIWSSQLETAREALARAELTAGDLAALGVTNQRET